MNRVLVVFMSVYISLAALPNSALAQARSRATVRDLNTAHDAADRTLTREHDARHTALRNEHQAAHRRPTTQRQLSRPRRR